VPNDVDIRREPRKPVDRSDLGIEVDVEAGDMPENRLVAIGDSLTHGFQSGAIYNTDLSYPALIARALGIYDDFRFPRYPGFGGVPFNIEFLVRDLERSFGATLSALELPFALFHARNYLSKAEEHWDGGAGSTVPSERGPINHNLGIYGWDLRDALERTADTADEGHTIPDGHHVVPLIKNAEHISAGRAIGSARRGDGTAMTPFEAARTLSEEGGIETLIVFLGANNALGSVIGLQVHWSGDGYDELKKKGSYNVWHPAHFASEWEQVADRVEEVGARHTIFGTVPHVTIAPIARGVKGKVAPGSRYFTYYTRPWIDEDDFDPADDEHLTADEARAIDSVIDDYNETIVASVRAAREKGLDWRVLDVAGILDRLAKRRYIEDPSVRLPEWWSQFPLPPEVGALEPEPDTHFFSSGPANRRNAGGLIALDGIHPTTVAYGVLAEEFIRVMQEAGVKFLRNDGSTREGKVRMDWPWLIGVDSLISQPPRSLGPDVNLVGWFDDRIDIIKRLWTCAA
jgi:hypothetical protein